MESGDGPSSPIQSKQPVPIVDSSDDEKPSNHHATVAVWWAFAANFSIAIMKLSVALFVVPSAALLSEALHSFGDALNSVTLIVGLKYSSRPPDRDHPFGYGLSANLWSLFASVFLIFAAGWAIHEGWERFHHPEHLGDITWAVVILFVSFAVEVYAVYKASEAVLHEARVEVKSFLHVIPKAFRHIDKVTTPTTRFVFYEDTLAVLGVVVALAAIVGPSISVHYGWFSPDAGHASDAIASMIIGVMMAALAFAMFKYNQDYLIGSAASEQVEQKISDTVLNLHGVSEIHDLKTMDQGISGLNVILKVEVEPEIMVKDVDDLTERIKEKLQEKVHNINQVYIEVLADERDEEWDARFEKLIEEGQKLGVLNKKDISLLRKAYDFSDTVLRDVMIPRTDAVYASVDTPLDKMAEIMVESGHTRIPIYGDSVDNIIGLVHSRDVFKYIFQNKSLNSLEEIKHDLAIYPETKLVSDLLEYFKTNKIRMAAVADEHGGFAGLVTVEDLMEEIFGEFWDEHDVEDLEIEQITDTKILVSGKYNIEELNEKLSLNFPEEEFVTIGGFVFGQVGREPELNDSVSFEDLTLTVAEVEGPRIVTVMIEAPEPFKLFREEYQSHSEEGSSSNGHRESA